MNTSPGSLRWQRLRPGGRGVTMGDFRSLFAGATKAAKLLDMKPKEFRELVRDGVLPPPCRLGEFERWDVEQLKAIASGEAADAVGQIEW